MNRRGIEACLRREAAAARTGLGRAEGCRCACGKTGLPGQTAALSPNTAHSWTCSLTLLLLHKRLTAGRPVDQYVVQQHAGEAAKHVHGPAGGEWYVLAISELYKNRPDAVEIV